MFKNINAATIENRMEIHYKTKNKVTIWPNNSTLSTLHKRIKNIYAHKTSGFMLINVHNSIIHNRQLMILKWIMTYEYNGISFNYKKEWWYSS